MKNTGSICPSCKRLKEKHHYLCKNCWFKLPPITRERLGLIDSKAAWRLKELYSEIAARTPLRGIDIPY